MSTTQLSDSDSVLIHGGFGIPLFSERYVARLGTSDGSPDGRSRVRGETSVGGAVVVAPICAARPWTGAPEPVKPFETFLV